MNPSRPCQHLLPEREQVEVGERELHAVLYAYLLADAHDEVRNAPPGEPQAAGDSRVRVARGEKPEHGAFAFGEGVGGERRPFIKGLAASDALREVGKIHGFAPHDGEALGAEAEQVVEVERRAVGGDDEGRGAGAGHCDELREGVTGAVVDDEGQRPSGRARGEQRRDPGPRRAGVGVDAHGLLHPPSLARCFSKLSGLLGGAYTPAAGDNGGVTLPETLRRALLRLAPEARRLLVAVSGGGDSVALLRLLLALPEPRWGLEVAHLDHALRPDAAEAAAFVRALCWEHGVACHTARVDVARIAKDRGWNLEDAARRLRYGFLTRTAKRVGADAVVTAHTQDDQAETVLMQLLRGAAHLQGMPARQGRVLRPLLEVPRSALRAYLRALGQDCLEDPTNADTSRTRAWVRHVLLPTLAARAPHVKATLARHAALQRDQAAHFRRLAQGLIKDAGAEVRALLAQDVAVQRAAVAELLRCAGVPVDAGHVEAVRAALPTPHPVRLLSLIHI